MVLGSGLGDGNRIVVHDGLDFQRAIARPELLRMRDLEQEGRNHDGTIITIALPGEAK